MSTYLQNAHDCLDEHETRYRRLSREDRRRARQWRPQTPTEIAEQARGRALGKMMAGVEAENWREVIRWATVLVDVDARLDMLSR